MITAKLIGTDLIFEVDSEEDIRRLMKAADGVGILINNIWRPKYSTRNRPPTKPCRICGRKQQSSVGLCKEHRSG